MKTTKLFLTIVCLLLLKTVSAQIWYEHLILMSPYPNFNSVSTKGMYFAQAVGDYGYCGFFDMPITEIWMENYPTITGKNLNSNFDVESYSPFYNIITYIVGDSGTIIKDDSHAYCFQFSPTICNLYSVYFTGILSGIAVGDIGTVIRTTDGGSQWNLISSNTQNRLYSVQFPSNNIGYAVGVNGTVIKTTDGGGNWIVKTQAIADTLRCVWFTDDNSGFVVSRNGTILKTTNGGDNWQSKPSGTTQNLNAICFENNNIGYAAGNNNILLKTTNNGETWITQTLPTLQRPGNFKSIATYNGIVFVVGSNGTAIGNFEDFAGSIQKYWNNGEVMITPNPAKDKIVINLQNTKNGNDLALFIYNLQGQLLLHQDLKQNNSEIDISQLGSGVYIAKIKLDDGSYKQEKFVVVK